MATNRTPGLGLPERLPRCDHPVADAEEFYRRFPPAAFTEAVVRRKAQRSSPWLAFATGGAAAAALGLALLLTLTGPEVSTAPPARPEGNVRVPFGYAGMVRDKGNVGEPSAEQAEQTSNMSLRVWKGEGFETVRDGQVLQPDNVLRFFYNSGSYDFVFVFSVDELGRVSCYYPDRDGYSVPIVRGRGVPLPDAVKLDDYVGSERFYALFTDEPISRHDVETAVGGTLLRKIAEGQGLEEMGRLPLTGRQISIMIEKR